MGKEYQRKVTIEGAVPVSPNIIFYDDMEGALKWTGGGTGTDWIMDKFAGTKEVNNGNYCLRMWTKATTPAVGDYVYITRPCTLRAWKVIRFSCFFYPETLTGYDNFRLILTWYTGSSFTMADIRWRKSLSRWEYCDANLIWQPIPGGSQTLYEYAHHYVSFIFDFGKKILRQFQCDDLLLDNLSLSGYSQASTVSSHLSVQAAVNSGAAAVQKMYLDDIIVEESL